MLSTRYFDFASKPCLCRRENDRSAYGRHKVFVRAEDHAIESLLLANRSVDQIDGARDLQAVGTIDNVRDREFETKL